MLDDSIDRDGQTGQDDGVLKPAQLFRAAQGRRSQGGNRHIGQEAVGPLHPLVGAKPADKDSHAENSGQGKGHDHQCHRPDQRIFDKAAPVGTGRLFRGLAVGQRQPGIAAVGHLDQPDCDQGQRNAAHQADFIGFKDTAGKDVEKERRNHQCSQPAGFQNCVTPLVEFGSVPHECWISCLEKSHASRAEAELSCLHVI